LLTQVITAVRTIVLTFISPLTQVITAVRTTFLALCLTTCDYRLPIAAGICTGSALLGTSVPGGALSAPRGRAGS
jgi:hypothetical protein